MIKTTDTFCGKSGNCVSFSTNKIYHTVSNNNNTKNKTRNNKKLYYLTNGHNRLTTGTIKAFCYEMNIFTVCSLFWKVKRVLSCVVLIVEFTVLVSIFVLVLVLLHTVLVRRSLLLSRQHGRWPLWAMCVRLLRLADCRSSGWMSTVSLPFRQQLCSTSRQSSRLYRLSHRTRRYFSL